VLNSAAAAEAMLYTGMTTQFIADFAIDLRGTRPSDNLVSTGWALAKTGERYIVYLPDGGTTVLSNLPSSYTASWFDPRSGASQPAYGGPPFTAPDRNDWVLYVAATNGQPTPTQAPPQPTPTQAPPTQPPPTQPPPTQPAPSPTSAPPQPPVPRPSFGVHLRVNFQTSGPAPQGDVLVDDGSVFSDRGNGNAYGWNADNRANARNRNHRRSPDEIYDTFNHLQRDGDFVWEIALPNGRYLVRIVAGDPAYFDSTFKIQAEDVLVLSGVPDKASYWLEGSAILDVRDGRLTLRSASDAYNNKIVYVEIVTATTGSSEFDHWLFLPHLMKK
jgi:hypothetical protein